MRVKNCLVSADNSQRSFGGKRNYRCFEGLASK